MCKLFSVCIRDYFRMHTCVNRPCGTHVVAHSSTNLHTCIRHIPTLILSSTDARTHKHTHTCVCLHTGGREAVGGEQLRIIRAIKPLRFFKIARLMKVGKVLITSQMYQRTRTHVHTHIRTQTHVHTHVASWPIAKAADGLPECVAFYYLFIYLFHTCTGRPIARAADGLPEYFAQFREKCQGRGDSDTFYSSFVLFVVAVEGVSFISLFIFFGDSVRDASSLNLSFHFF